MKIPPISYGKLIFSLVICQCAGIIGSLFTIPSIPSWYASLIKPSFNPPSYLFGPVWLVLYFMMGISLYLLLQAKDAKLALSFFWVQLALNTLWSILFFGMHLLAVALLEILLLWICILLTILYGYKVSKPAAYLLIPYMLWVSFASILTYAIYALN